MNSSDAEIEPENETKKQKKMRKRKKYIFWKAFERGENAFNSSRVRQFICDRQFSDGIIIMGKVQASMKSRVYNVTVCSLYTM